MSSSSGFGLYIHWPFCTSKCPYCDFNSYTFKTIEHDLWLKAYLKEMNIYQGSMNGPLQSIFFGGGTPSLMHPSIVEALILNAKKIFNCTEDIEVTLEANPGTIDLQKMRDLKDSGVNRLSIGIQSLRDDNLKFLGREHDAYTAIKAIENCSYIFDNYSFDMIYAIPQQSMKDWHEELSYMLSFDVKHLSLYQLTIEVGTPFAMRQDIIMPSNDLMADLYLLTDALTAAKGLFAYEISNYARDHHKCVHNMIYWQYKNFIGIGPGAHSRLNLSNFKNKVAQHNIKIPKYWLQAVLEDQVFYSTRTQLSRKTQEQERLLMGLRTTDGVALPESKELDTLMRAGLIEKNQNNKFFPTLDGRQKLNMIIGYLTSHEWIR